MAKRNDKFYCSDVWKKLRLKQLAKQPLCEECLRHGKITPAKIVDHIKPINFGGEKLDINNLQSLCVSCHSRKSALEGSTFGIRNSRDYNRVSIKLLPKGTKLIILYGKSRKKKEKYIRASKTHRDLCLDMNYIIRELTHKPLYCSDKNDWKAAKKERSRLLNTIKPKQYERVFLVLKKPNTDTLEYYKNIHNAELIEFN